MEEIIKGYVIDMTGIINIGIIIYAAVMYLSYIFLASLSGFAMKKYKRKNSFVDYNKILSTDFAPSVSLIAPAYNESMTIVDNIKSLLSIHYNNTEIIIVNDGSIDNSLELLIKEYELTKVEMPLEEKLKTKKIRGVYKAKNTAYQKLIVVDKENGGKADALNAGINVSRNSLIACIDVDCILEPDSLLKLVKPFMEEKKKVIATGGVIRVANNCDVKDGFLQEVKVPANFFARVQVLEYFRAFLMGRMAWGYMDGLLIISGAFGMFDKETVIRAGGYNTQTVGEDMELLVRMRRVMYDEKIPCKVAFIPDPLCWTEDPQDPKILLRQRNRWTRGTAETLKLHRKMILNPRYGIHGMLSLPFWVLFEWMAPLVEFIGFLTFVLLAILGYVNWIYVGILFGFAYSFAVMFSIFAIFFEERSYQQYRHITSMLKLVITAFLEPVFYHPLTVWSAVKGNFDLLMGKKSWGKMVRTGFNKNLKLKKAANI